MNHLSFYDYDTIVAHTVNVHSLNGKYDMVTAQHAFDWSISFMNRTKHDMNAAKRNEACKRTE